MKSHANDCFKINSTQIIKMSKISAYAIFKIFEIKAKSPFMIYSDFVSILRSENNGKQNHDEFHTNKCQKYVVCS